MKRKILVSLVIAALLIGSVFAAGCSGGSASSANSSYKAEESYSAYSSAGSAAESYAADGDYYEMEIADEELGYAPAEYAGNADTANGSALVTQEQAGDTSNSAFDNAKLIYTAHLSMETVEFDQAVSAIKTRVEKAGGYIEFSNLSNYGSYRMASYTIRVPAAQYRYFVDTAGEIASIRTFNENVQNVSEQYYDSEARLNSAKAKLETLQELLKKAETMEDIITIQEAISEVEYDIDYYAGTLRRYDSSVSFSSISIDLQEVSRLSGTEEPPIGFGQELAQAFSRGTKNFVSGIQDLLLSFARHFIGWLIFITIVVIVVVIIVVQSKRRKARQAQLAAQQAAYQKQYEAYRQAQSASAAPAANHAQAPVNAQTQKGTTEEANNAPDRNQESSGNQ